jgi:hypothetical protein
LIKSTIALFVVIDPIGSVPLFIVLTEKMDKNERITVSKIAIVTAAALLIIFAVAGSQILTLFGVTNYSFMVAGGVLLFIVSIELLTHGVWRFGVGTGREVGESGVVPSFACWPRCNYFSNDFISNWWIDSDNVIYFYCDCHYLYNSAVGQSYL